MLSIANVRSAGGAANYFSADNYYTKADADRSGQWLGKGADRLGLMGPVEAAAFEAILRGELPDGMRLGNDKQPHRPGTDLTFSMPKSWSLLALVGGDRRILEAYRASVVDTLAWAEARLAHTRVIEKGKETLIPTGNLVIALFQHDTNRNQEPNVHFHAVIANLTQGPDGKWRSLRNDRLWAMNTLLNSMTMSHFRGRVEALGYDIGSTSTHGNFEARGLSRKDIMVFSTRRQDVLDARRGPGLEAGLVAALATRKAKPVIEDRSALAERWNTFARAHDIDLGGVIRTATARGKEGQNRWDRLADAAHSMGARGLIWLEVFAEKLGAPMRDTLVPANIHLKGRGAIAAAQATAAAVRHLSEREAAFKETDLLKSALDFGMPTGVSDIEARIEALLRSGEVVRGRGRDASMMTTARALQAEENILREVAAGQGQGQALVPSGEAGKMLQAQARKSNGFDLNVGQEAAGRLLLTSTNRIIAIQGVAGAGKSTMLKPASRLIEAQGRYVLGLAVQNTLVQMLKRDLDIPAMTLARFLGQHAALLRDNPDSQKLTEVRGTFKGAVLLLDEASMVGNADKEKLVRLANLLQVERLALVGDRKQLGAVDAGKPFAMLQQAGIETQTMNANVRARERAVRTAQIAAQAGDVGEALRALEGSTIEAPGKGAETAAIAWLSLSPAERGITAIYASGRRLRDDINSAIQTGLLANGELGPGKMTVDTLARVNTTQEELRHATTYAPRQVLEVRRTMRKLGLGKGRWGVVDVDARSGQVILRSEQGQEKAFYPDRLRPGGTEDALRLSEIKRLDLHEGDRIRWTENDPARALFNADRARIVSIRNGAVTVETSSGDSVTLNRNDRMLQRLDLAYALNAHMAQGLTSDRGIAVMDSRERNLSNKQTFLVTITRLRDHLTLIVDNSDRIERAIISNEGSKTSALEVTERLKAAAAEGLGKGAAREYLAKSGDTGEIKQPERAKVRTKGMTL
jgi:conjugative relaxase-like TrwC/TraI family protein